MIFNPRNSRRELKNWAFATLMKLSYQEAFREQRLGNCGVAMMGSAIEALLAGLFTEGRKLVARANAFLKVSIDRSERSDYGLSTVLEVQALSNWILHGMHDIESLAEAVRWKEDWFDFQRQKPQRSDLQASLPMYLEAHEYETLIDRFESSALKAPANLHKIQGEGTMAYAIAKQKLVRAPEQETVVQALSLFLARSVPKWLDQGFYSTAARWMKIAHWQPGDDPIATLLRCYDYLPDLKPPKHPHSKFK